MLSKKLMLLSAMLFFTAFCVFGQDKDTVIVENEEGVKDTILINNDDWNNKSDDNWDDESDNNWNDKSEDNWGSNWGDEINWNFDMMQFHGKPAISINYGLSQIKRNNFSSSFGDPNLVEGRIGYMSDRSEWEDIGKYKYDYFRFGNYSTELTNKKINSNDFQSSMWRFGFGWESGYDWKFGESAIIPYNTFAIDWSRVELKSFAPAVTSEEEDALKRFDKTFRFGTSTEAGIKFRMIAGITLEAGYERSIIFERHLFWKWAGSTVIEVAAQGLLDTFIDRVMDSSPYAAPIVNFILKNALSYGIYELRQEKMNWPFNSEAPLAYNQFKFGMTFLF